jgi:UDP-N-acetylmuramyl pentapeptide synthase
VACRTTHDALPVLGYQVAPGDVLLVKGSRAMAMEQLVDALAARRWKLAA